MSKETDRLWRDHIAHGARLDMIQSQIAQTGGPKYGDATEYWRLVNLYDAVEAEYHASYLTWEAVDNREHPETRPDRT